MSVSFLDDVIFFLVINVLQQNTLSPRQGNINAQIESQILYLKKLVSTTYTGTVVQLGAYIVYAFSAELIIVLSRLTC